MGKALRGQLIRGKTCLRLWKQPAELWYGAELSLLGLRNKRGTTGARRA